MDSEFLMGILTLLNAAMTTFQEWRRRKEKKAAKKVRPSELLP